jgi:hypothetical protein
MSAAAGQQLLGMAGGEYNAFTNDALPSLDAIGGTAATAASPEEQELAAGQAHADVTNAFNNERTNFQQQALAAGARPDSGAYLADMDNLNLGQAASDAQAQNQARLQQRLLGFQEQSTVAGLGNNLAGIAGSTASNASGSGLGQAQLAQSIRNQNLLNAGYAAKPVATAVGNWVSDSLKGSSNNQTSTPAQFQNSTQTQSVNPNGILPGTAPSQSVNPSTSIANWGATDPASYGSTGLGSANAAFNSGGQPYADGGEVQGADFGYADGGAIYDGETGRILRPRKFARRGLAGGGAVFGPGTTTSDSIPAVIDGKTPAKLSTGEFVLNADAVRLIGRQKLEALNQRGLEMRRHHALLRSL